MATSLAKLLEHRYGALGVPVELVLPDGDSVRLSDPPEVRVDVRSFQGLRALRRPAMGRLASAYVHGDLDFSGSARRILATAERMVGDVAGSSESMSARLKLWLSQRRENRENIDPICRKLRLARGERFESNGEAARREARNASGSGGSIGQGRRMRSTGLAHGVAAHGGETVAGRPPASPAHA